MIEKPAPVAAEFLTVDQTAARFNRFCLGFAAHPARSSDG